MNVRAAGLTRVALLALIWGSGFLWIEICLRGFSPVQITFARLALGAVVLLLVLWRAGTRLPGGRVLWGHLVVAALLANALPYTLFGIGQQHVASNFAGAINATTPLWTLLIALATRTERTFSGIRAAGLLLGFTGAFVILSPWDTEGTSLGGALACLVASAGYGASYVYMGRYLTTRGLPPILLSASQLIAASGWLVLASPFGGFDAVELRADAVVSLLILGAVGTGIAYVLNYRIITDDGPILASTVTYLLPVVAVILGWLFLDEPITAQIAIGVTVVLVGVALTRRQPPTSNARRPPDRPLSDQAPRSGKGPRQALFGADGLGPHLIIPWSLGGPALAVGGVGTIVDDPAGPASWLGGGAAVIVGSVLVVAFIRYLRRPTD